MTEAPLSHPSTTGHRATQSTGWGRTFQRATRQPTVPRSAATTQLVHEGASANGTSSNLPVITQIFQCPKWKVTTTPKLSNTADNKPLAMYFLAEEKLSSAITLLERCSNPASAAFKESADRVHMCQRILLNTIYLIYSGMDPSHRASRNYRQYLPDEDQHELNRSFSESILFAAQALSRGFQIRGIEGQSDVLRRPATELCASLDALRFVFRHRAQGCTRAPYVLLYPVLGDFDRAWTTFERQLCFAYFDVGNSELRNSGNNDITVDDDQQLELLTVILSECVLRALSRGIVQSDDLESFEPAVILAIPRLSLVHALLYSPDSLSLTDPDQAFWWFRSHAHTLQQVQYTLQRYPEKELGELEHALATGDASLLPLDVMPKSIVRENRKRTDDRFLLTPSFMKAGPERSRSRRNGAAKPPPSPVHSLISNHSVDMESSYSLDDPSATPPASPRESTMLLSSQSIFLEICKVADGLQSGTFAKPFLKVMQQVFQIHANSEP
ncbi:hypothetical protein IWQ62_005516 [Dispira parvispora]|uniref:Uncharacterized protein n=1 Tax=Dispira parvispora TaxID=1520584 RepID=A0A9W8E4G3_9FUNG|nr:hypothetical protein IWQ62_005516 [Dispira parvispora]